MTFFTENAILYKKIYSKGNMYWGDNIEIGRGTYGSFGLPGRIEQLKQRLIRSSKVQEGEQPPENPTVLLEELEHNISELSNLV